MPLQKLAQSQKTIATRVDWTPDDADESGWARFLVPLSIRGITEAGLVLEGGTFIGYPERNVCFEVSLRGHKGIRRIPLMRVEWRSLRGGHSNQRRSGCVGPWAGRRVPETHIHTFEGNWLAEKSVMRPGDLPCAEPIVEPLQTFEDFRRYAGSAFRINNISVVPRPEWRYDLFDD